MALRGITIIIKNGQQCSHQIQIIRCGNLTNLHVSKSLDKSWGYRKGMATAAAPALDGVCKPLTPLKEARRFMVDCIKAVGAKQEVAEIVADNLIGADSRGHYSHGMNRLEMYMREAQLKETDPCATGEIEKETVATALVNGHNGFGAVVGKFCMDLAICKAKDTGVALVVAHASNHFGIGAVFAAQAIDQGFIGMALTNSSPFMVPTRAKEAALGTNPIALGAPGIKPDSFVLDFATTAVAVGKIELARRKGQPIPEGWALNESGEMETNPEIAVKAGRLMPLGGSEANSGYKGFGFGMFVEVFCGILSGSNYGPKIRKWGTHCELANLGQAFLAVNPCAFAPGVQERMSDLMNRIRCMEPKDPSKPVVVPGDVERLHMEKVNSDGGLCYVKNQHETCAKLACEFKVKPLISC